MEELALFATRGEKGRAGAKMAGIAVDWKEQNLLTTKDTKEHGEQESVCRKL
jgi:hypothetical protein